MTFLHALLALLMLLVYPIQATYILRYSATDNGGVLFTGNTLGLSKAAQQNQPGSLDSIGAFITTDTSQKVGNYLAGTTLVWQNNSSTAYLDLPEGSIVLYAELIWSGSYGFQNQITGNEPNTPVTLINPQDNSFAVPPDPATAQVEKTPGFANAGNYVRSADVTSIVQAGGAGVYTVGGVPGTISGLDDTHNVAGWTLAVAFHNGAMATSNLSIFVGCEQASSATSAPATVSGFCAPTSGPLNGQLFISAIEGDANKQGDRMLFGSALPLTIAANSLSGVNNPINNFFASQINTLLPFTGTRFVSSADLDTRGSFGNFNANAFTGQILPASRQGYDITAVDISSQLTHGETVAYAKGTTTGDDYTINALGMQIQVGAPTFQISKLVDGTTAVQSALGDVVTFSFTVSNTGTLDASLATFIDPLETGLSFNAGTVIIDGTSFPALNPITGFLIGTAGAFPIGDSTTISFQATITSYPSEGNVFFNNAFVDYSYQPCGIGPLVALSSASSLVQIELPFANIPALTTTKLVNSSTAIGSSVGDTVVFSATITNNGLGDALNVTFQDPLQQGLELVPGSVLVNGEVVSPDPDLSTGFSVGSIAPGETLTVLFQAVITSQPIDLPLYYNGSSVGYEYLDPAGDFIPLDPASSNVVTINLNVAPLGFEGVIQKCKYVNRTTYCADTTWVPAFSFNVVAYRIYLGSKLLLTVPATENVARVCGLSKKQDVYNLTLTAVYSNNLESSPINIRIL